MKKEQSINYIELSIEEQIKELKNKLNRKKNDNYKKIGEKFIDTFDCNDLSLDQIFSLIEDLFLLNSEKKEDQNDR